MIDFIIAAAAVAVVAWTVVRTLKRCKSGKDKCLSWLECKNCLCRPECGCVIKKRNKKSIYYKTQKM